MKPFFVAIAGGTCSGKTTLAENLRQKLEEKYLVTVINMDHYFKNPTPTVIAPITGIEYPEHNHPDSLKLDEMMVDLDAALAGESDVVIIEGLFALYLDWIRTRADVKVFVDLESDARLARRIVKFMKRDQSYDNIVNRYLDTVRFRHNELIEPTRWHADMVINGTPTKGADILKCYIESNIDR